MGNSLLYHVPHPDAVLQTQCQCPYHVSSVRHQILCDLEETFLTVPNSAVLLFSHHVPGSCTADGKAVSFPTFTAYLSGVACVQRSIRLQDRVLPLYKYVLFYQGLQVGIMGLNNVARGAVCRQQHRI